MKTRFLWLAILSLGCTALYFGIARPHVSSIPRGLRDSISDLKPVSMPPLEVPLVVIPPLPSLTPPPLQPIAPPAMRPIARLESLPIPEVPIQDRSTIDFSTGAPMVKSHGKDQDALESALREIAEAADGTPAAPKK